MTNRIRLTVLGLAVAVNVAALGTLHVAMVRGEQGAQQAAAEQAVERIVITASRLDVPEAQAFATCPTQPTAL